MDKLPVLPSKANAFTLSLDPIPPHLLKDIVLYWVISSSMQTLCVFPICKKCIPLCLLPSHFSCSLHRKTPQKRSYTHPLHLLFPCSFLKLFQTGFPHHHSPETTIKVTDNLHFAKSNDKHSVLILAFEQPLTHPHLGIMLIHSFSKRSWFSSNLRKCFFLLLLTSSFSSSHL